jgi:type II secretory pathway pseudopilin PulG
MNTENPNPTPRVDLASEDGFTIIEVLVTAVVVVLVMIATFGALESAGRATAEQRHHAESYAIAQKDQARLRSLQISELSGLDETTTVNAGGAEYTVHSTGEFVNDTTGSASCDEGTNTSDYISITSAVSWPSIGERDPTMIKSIVAPPNGSLSDDTGALAVVVRDGAGNGIEGIPLTGTGAGSFSGPTGPTGCILFTDLPEGNYTLTPSTASGVVDADGDPPIPITASVVAQSTNTVVLRYDTPGSINVTFKTRINGTVVATTQDTIVVFNTGMTEAATYGTVGTRVTTLAATSLFPFSSPDAVYAGSCAENNPDPDELGDPAVAGAKADVSVISNQATPAEIQLPALDLTVKTGNSSSSPGTVLSGATVKITDTQCSVGGTPVKRTYTTNASGKLSTPGMPFGIYDICAWRSSTNRRNTLSGVPVQTTTTDTVRTIYLGSSASGSSSGACP